MRARSAIAVVAAALAALAVSAASTRAAGAIDPAGDAKAFRAFFVKRFPDVKLEDFVNGPYSMNEDMRKQWQDIDGRARAHP
jgi:L-cysteine S-thiosulfotransferase